MSEVIPHLVELVNIVLYVVNLERELTYHV